MALNPRPIPPTASFQARIELPTSAGQPEQVHLFEDDDANAIRAALAARRPLLVKGEPGVGKTQLAEAAAWVLQRPFVPFVVDSRTESRDLLWTFDAVQRLADAQIASALGADEPIAPELPADAELPVRGKRITLEERLNVRNYIRPGPLWWAFDWEGALAQAHATRSSQPLITERAVADNGVVVLIDEIDKADSDLPNGLLEALGAGRFQPRGWDRAVEIQGEWPLVVITTNEERDLPNAFVRRCLVHHLTLPKPQEELTALLIKRAQKHFNEDQGGSVELYTTAANQLVTARRKAETRGSRPLPGQAEYFDLLRAVLHLSKGTTQTPAELLAMVQPFLLEKQAKEQP